MVPGFDAKASSGRVGTTSTMQTLKGGVLSDFYSLTKIVQPLTSPSGLSRVRLCSVSICCDSGQGMHCPTPSLHPLSPAQRAAQAPRE